MQDLAAQDKDEWSANLAALKKQIITEQQEKEAAVVMAATRLTAAEGQELEQRCNEVGVLGAANPICSKSATAIFMAATRAISAQG